MITSIWTNPGGDATAARDLRREVFQQELGLADYETMESMDGYCYHLVLVMNGEAVATGRITYGGAGTAKLTGICVKQKYRRQGIGDGLVKVLDYKASQLGMRYSALDAEESQVPFYQRIGYVPSGEKFTKWGRTLVPMKKETNDGTRENCAHQCPGP